MKKATKTYRERDWDRKQNAALARLLRLELPDSVLETNGQATAAEHVEWLLTASDAEIMDWWNQ